MRTLQPPRPATGPRRHPAAPAGAPDCHALRIRLGPPVDDETVGARLAAHAGAARLWVEPVPDDADSPAAARRRDRELSRPVAAGLRAVLIRYADGPADLVLVARRDAWDPPALRRLGAAFRGGTADPAPTPATDRPAAPAGGGPAWGLGDPRAGDAWGEDRTVLPGHPGGDPATWLAALAVLLARYQPEETPVVGALGVRAGEDVTALAVATPDDLPLDALTAGLRERLAAPADPAPPSPVPVGVAFDLGDPADEYVPCLAPRFPLTVVVGRDADGHVELRWRHRLVAVSPAVAAQVVRHLAHLHRQVTTATPPPVAAADLDDPAERERIAALGRPARPLASTPRRLPDVFADRVAERPDAVALSAEDARVSYRELDEWSNRLAHGLRAHGVRDGDLVGVCLDRSAELVATLLAVLKAGAVYVPMDTAYPADRLAYTVRDSGLAVLVTTHAEFPRVDGITPVTPTALAAAGHAGADAPPDVTAGPEDPAYVIYTSGSTGRPKGVVVPHANVAALLDATRDDFGLGPADVWTFFHSAAFDFSVWEIWGALLTGGHLVVVPYWVSRSPEQFHELLVERRVTVLNQTPSSFAQLVEADRQAAGPLAVRLVIFGGEPLDARSLLPWFDRHPESACRLVNMFGITETTVHVTAGDVTRAGALAASRSVGRPLPGWSVRIRDTAGRPVPPGVPGEIHVGGVGVATGYLGRPDLTAERFAADPETGERTYRSGDRGRLLPDGTLEHLGRIDNQVKLRGFRIELDEIRSVLTECPGVAAAAVVLRRTDPDDPATGRIDAYVVRTGGGAAPLRERLRRKLPEYMLPATITELPALPTTANGKVDRDALPAPAAEPATAEAPAQAAGDDLAGGLLGVWQQVFGRPVGVADNFFELGGNSLLAVRMAAIMRERGLPRLHPRTLYLNPTLRGLADALRTG
ncbi:amino acid adenylation domain-containing protein [Micromonospora chersina]